MNLCILLAVVWLAFVATTLPTHAGQQPLASPNDEVPRISVNVDLVVLHATVTDRHGHLVPDLARNNFQVYENGAPQQIGVFRHEDVPVAAGLVVDHSGSMHSKLAEVSAAARSFVHSSNPEDQMFVVNFNEKVSLGLPGPVHFSNSPTELESAILAGSRGGKTALYDAIVEALEQLKASNLDKKVLIVISDGGDNASAHNLRPGLEAGRAIQRDHLCHRHLRSRGCGPESACSQSPRARNRRRSILPQQEQRRSECLQQNRTRHSQPVHHRLRSHQSHAGRWLPGDPSGRAVARPRQAVRAHAHRIYRPASSVGEERKLQ